MVVVVHTYSTKAKAAVTREVRRNTVDGSDRDVAPAVRAWEVKTRLKPRSEEL